MFRVLETVFSTNVELQNVALNVPKSPVFPRTTWLILISYNITFSTWQTYSSITKCSKRYVHTYRVHLMFYVQAWICTWNLQLPLQLSNTSDVDVIILDTNIDDTNIPIPQFFICRQIFFCISGRPREVEKALRFTHELSFFLFYQSTAFSSHAVDGHKWFDHR